MGKTKKIKPECCGKYKKKHKHCSRCPVLFKEQCKLETERSIMGKKKEKKKEDKKKKRKKAEKALQKKMQKKKEKKAAGKKKDKKKNKKK